jgi:hypothetical protein
MISPTGWIAIGVGGGILLLIIIAFAVRSKMRSD